jgi:D-glycero-D-manno-heptose 1,7-bisphosphate phosphatase
MNKCIFLDRDGVLNKDFVDYAYSLDRFIILEGVVEALHSLKQADYKLIVVTNQSGIAKGIYTREDMEICHSYLQETCGGVIDHFYFAPGHQSISESLSRKPGTMMFEKGIAKFDTDIARSWMIGDKRRDMIPAQKMGLKTILVGNEEDPQFADYSFNDLLEASRFILSS